MNKKKLDEEFEKVITVGEGTVEEAKNILLSEEKESKKKRDTVIDTLDSKSKHTTFLTYNQLVADLLAKRLNYYIDPRGFTFKCIGDKNGVILELYSPTGNIFRSAFKPVGIAQYDLNAVEVYAERTESTIDRYERSHQGITNPKDSSIRSN